MAASLTSRADTGVADLGRRQPRVTEWRHEQPGDTPGACRRHRDDVFETYFGYNQAKAGTLMLQVHNDGRAVVSSGTREQMETDVDAMHSYGLWATLEKA
jgi:hypothetical protein